MLDFMMILLLLCVHSAFFIIGCIIGYKVGFAECKKIDDKILIEFRNKYNLGE